MDRLREDSSDASRIRDTPVLNTVTKLKQEVTCEGRIYTEDLSREK